MNVDCFAFHADCFAFHAETGQMTADGWPSRYIDAELRGPDPGWIETLFYHRRTLMERLFSDHHLRKCPNRGTSNKAGYYGYRHFLFYASSDAIFYLHISKEPIELFRIVILTFENEARSEELWRFMCDDTLVGFDGYNYNCAKFRTNTRDDTKILLA